MMICCSFVPVRSDFFILKAIVAILKCKANQTPTTIMIMTITITMMIITDVSNTYTLHLDLSV
jgi:hypothetical protein